ncbi:putative endonuclease [Fontibacillus panacisegetis]|uniref:UPF0102 protein SAMN04488542_101448 n=1 Tax=Fontibacillus panacisegetis TaxID=670482 RepID=A0A1G7F389_9BACL|nr:YraN family protein [Fontibacillus panacisegetis]SDE70359.1 putative endonuclease [Fontibacillus panacisegetis]
MSMNDGLPGAQKRVDMDQRKARGSVAEQIAADYLIQQGYKVLERNWRCRSGEIDIVAETGHTVVIVEVRSRGKNSFTFGSPLESITSRKIKQVRDTAAVYLHRISKSNARIRFDVIGIIMSSDGNVDTLDHIIDAF